MFLLCFYNIVNLKKIRVGPGGGSGDCMIVDWEGMHVGGVGWGWFGMGLISGAATAGYFTNMRG